MRPSPDLRPTPWDALVVLAVLALAAALALAAWLPHRESSGQLTAAISLDGQLEETLPLTADRQERTIANNGYTLHLLLTETEVWVESADCPTQDCVHTGHISRTGQSIVCLPARVVVELQGGVKDGDAVDAVIG